MEDRPPRQLARVLDRLNKTQKIRRRDGATQTVNGDEWARRSDNVSGTGSALQATREEVIQTRKAIELHLREVEVWEKSTFAPADAQTIVSQLAGSGQIRVGPTRWQQMLADINKWFRDLMRKLMQWIGGLFPQAKPGAMPKINPLWIQVFFYATVFALLALLVFLTWRAIGGRMGRRGARRGTFADTEDAELLLLPPDELRLRAQNFAAEGNFREALRHLYIALLLDFEARGVWRYDPRRTNWEHIAALRSAQEYCGLVPSLSHVTRTFDRVRYGNAEFDESDWARFEKEVDLVNPQVATAGDR